MNAQVADKGRRTQVERALLKRNARDGKVSLATLLFDTPPCARNMTVGDVVGMFPQVGPQRVRRATKEYEGIRLSDLDMRQRAKVLAKVLEQIPWIGGRAA